MKLNTNFTVAVHIVLCIEFFNKSQKVTSDFIASSTNTNPVIIRKILKKLQDANLVQTKAGVGGSFLAKEPQCISLLDIYKAVADEQNKTRSVFNFHSMPNPKCPVGSKIHKVLDAPLASAQKMMEDELGKTSIKMLLDEM